MKKSFAKTLSFLSTFAATLSFTQIAPNALRFRGNAIESHLKPNEEFSIDSLKLFEKPAQNDKISDKISPVFKIGSLSLLSILLTANEASAKGGEYGIWEGRSFALLHPIIMGSMFAVSGYAAILGLKWRELRTMGKAINLVKEKGPMLSSGQRAKIPFSDEISSINRQISIMDPNNPKVKALKNDLALLTTNKSVEEEYNSLVDRRKTLTKQNVRERHYEMGSILLALGVFAAIEGPVNTYIRAGKLFPGPHLYVGAGIVVLWALAAALVQDMQRGNEYARYAHIGINFGILGLFAWQVNTGLQITEKVLQFTKFP